ncbi:MAG: AMP-binding protein [Acidimicrobiales bacterium]
MTSSTASPWAAHLDDPASFEPAQLTEGGTMPALWAARWEREPSAPVLRFEGEGSRDRWRTAGQLDEATRRAAALLAAAGLSAGERMVWSAEPSFDAVVSCLAALRLGAVVVPANLTYTERELGHVVADTRPAVVVVERPDQAAWVAAAAPGLLAALRPDLSYHGSPHESSHRSGTGNGDAAREPELDTAGADDPALIVYTSGTTGSPKGAVLSHGNLLAAVRSLALGWRWQPDDRLVLALPLFHVHGLCAGLFGTLTAGASSVVLPKFSPDAVLGAAGKHSATLYFGVPTMYHRLLGSGRAGELSRLRLCISGSAPLPTPLWSSLRREADVAVLERYGMTETMLTVSNPYDGERRPGTVGFPLPGVVARLTAFDDGGSGAGAAAEVEPTEGQLLVSGPSVFGGYWERPAATEDAFEGRWFRTGDLAGRDADGYLSILGRRHDLILSGGFNVYPAEVEDVLLAHPDVAEVAVAGEPSDEWGETVVAWVVPGDARPGAADLEALAADRLAPYKRPRHYRLVGSLPRNAMGKVQRDRLGR